MINENSVITMDSPVVPAQVLVREFTGYNTKGIPSDAQPTVS